MLEVAIICLIHSVHKDSGSRGVGLVFPLATEKGWVWGGGGDQSRGKAHTQLQSFKRVMKRKETGFLWDRQPRPRFLHASQLQSYAGLKAPASAESLKRHQGSYCEMLKEEEEEEGEAFWKPTCWGVKGGERPPHQNPVFSYGLKQWFSNCPGI